MTSAASPKVLLHLEPNLDGQPVVAAGLIEYVFKKVPRHLHLPLGISLGQWMFWREDFGIGGKLHYRPSSWLSSSRDTHYGKSPAQ